MSIKVIFGKKLWAVSSGIFSLAGKCCVVAVVILTVFLGPWHLFGVFFSAGPLHVLS